jgi:hypothetical protein
MMHTPNRSALLGISIILLLISIAILSVMVQEAEAQTTPQRPINIVRSKVKTVTAVRQSLKDLAGVSNSEEGRSGVKIANISSNPVCVGGSDVDTSITAPNGKCYPICAAAACPESIYTARSTIDAIFVIASIDTAVFLHYGNE